MLRKKIKLKPSSTRRDFPYATQCMKFAFTGCKAGKTFNQLLFEFNRLLPGFKENKNCMLKVKG